MAALVLLVLVSALVGGSDATWCICRTDASAVALQKTLDYACGAGADCNPIIQNGACYNPNTVLAHCSYAANSYYQRKGEAAGTCDFSGTATVTTVDPSYTGCTFPATASAAGTPTTPTSSTPGTPPTTTGTPTIGTPTIGTPTSTTTFSPPIGGLGPTGTGGGIATDGSAAGHRLLNAGPVCLSLAITLLSGAVLLRPGW